MIHLQSEGAVANGDGDAPKLKKKATRDQIPTVEAMDFSSEAKTKDGKSWNWKFASMNVNGIRAWAEVKKIDNHFSSLDYVIRQTYKQTAD